MKNMLFVSALMAVALAGCGARTPAADQGMAGTHRMPDGTMMMNNDMAGMNHSMPTAPMAHDSMTMADMVNMLKGKTGDELDRAFLEGMIPHHQGAVDMAELILKDAKHEELRKMAQDIIVTQQREIDMMKQWQKDWGYTK